MKTRWETFKGKRFLYCDFSNFERDAAALEAEVNAADALILAEPKGSVLALADLTNTVTSSQVVDLFKRSASRTHGYVRKQAVVGITGIQKILAQAVARFSKQPLVLFETADQAREWLAADKGAGTVLTGDFTRPQ